MIHCHRAGYGNGSRESKSCTTDGEQYRCCFALCTSVEHHCVCYAKRYSSHFPKSTRGTAGYGVLHGPILLEEQEIRSGTSSFCRAAIDNFAVIFLWRSLAVNLSCDLFQPPLGFKVDIKLGCLLRPVKQCLPCTALEEHLETRLSFLFPPNPFI